MAGVEDLYCEVCRAGAGAGGRLMKRGQVVIVVLGESSRIAAGGGGCVNATSTSASNIKGEEGG